MSSDVVKCPKDWFSVRETCRENKDMVCGGRAKKPARAQREDYAEQRELKSLSSHGAVFFHKTLPGLPIYPVLPAGFISRKENTHGKRSRNARDNTVLIYL